MAAAVPAVTAARVREREATAQRLLRSSRRHSFEPGVDIDWDAPLVEGLWGMPGPPLVAVRDGPAGGHDARMGQRYGVPDDAPRPVVQNLGRPSKTVASGAAMFAGAQFVEEVLDQFHGEAMRDETVRPLTRIVNKIHVTEEPGTSATPARAAADPAGDPQWQESRRRSACKLVPFLREQGMIGGPTRSTGGRRTLSDVLVSAADGTSLSVLVDGPAEAPVTVVLTHGWTLDSRTWGPVARSLAPAARVVRYDHRGHGRSAAVGPGTMTLEQLADDLAAVVEQVAPEGPLVLGGHSMGGMTIMALAERRPDMLDRVRGVALVATASGGLANHTLGLPPAAAAVVARGQAWAQGRPGWETRRHLGNPAVLGPGLRWLLLGRNPGAEARRVTVESVAACRPATMSGFRPALEAHERDAALAAFARFPTVVLAGDRDRLTPVRLSRRIADALPSAQLTVFPAAGHMLPLERVAGVAGRLSALVAAAAAPPRAA